MNYKKLFSNLSICLILCSSGCSDKPYIKKTRLLMSTIIEITAQDGQAIDAAFKEFERLEKLLNKFAPDSEISRLNQLKELKMSESGYAIIKKSTYFNKISNGAFDITISPLADLWKKAISSNALPDKIDIDNNLKNIGSDKILIKENYIVKLAQNTQIDLGGIAKGYAVDAAISILRDRGVKSALVNAGGNMYCLGKRYDKKWSIGIQDPRNPEKIVRKLELENQGISTSGDYQQFFIHKNKRYSHIINPKTGYPVDNDLESVTVIADDATTADVLSTTIFVLGQEKGYALIKNMPGVKTIIFSEKDGN
jgi:FAD:protein FMN transferase